MAIFGKESVLRAVAEMSCPRCHEGKMFETGSFSFKKSFDMNARCPVCNQHFTPEPGFYFGAMFVSYILTGWFCVLFMLGTHWLLGWSFDRAFLLMILVVGLLFVWIFRISRALWLHFNVKYDPAALHNSAAKP